jgi:hypothetical protein
MCRLCYCAVALLTVSANASILHGTGEMHYSVLDSNGVAMATEASDFLFWRGSNSWMVGTSKPETNDFPRSEMWGNEGLIYSISRWPANRTYSPPQSKKRFLGSLNATMEIREQDFPGGSQVGFCFPVWLSMGSTDFFRKHSLIPPLLRADLNNIDLKNHNTIRVTPTYREGSEWAVIAHLEFINVGKHLEPVDENEPDIPVGAYKEVAYRAPFDQGFKEASYKVLGWTNLAGVDLPLASELVLYAPNWQAVRASKNPNPIVAPIAKFELLFKSLSFKSDDAFNFSPIESNKLIKIIDNRTLVQGVPIQYITTNGMLSSTSPNIEKIARRTEYRLKETNAAKRVFPWKRISKVFFFFIKKLL